MHKFSVLVTKIFYTFFSTALMLSSIILTFYAFRGYWNLYRSLSAEIDMTVIFESVIFITLAMAVFDLSKTVFEEEVIFEKDPMKHSEVRRTLTRFLSAITIAASIEVLTLIFKFSLVRPENLLYAAYLLYGLALLIAAMGVYVFLGIKAELKKDKM